MKSKVSTKKGYFKRLREESLVLSCLAGLSSRLIYFLKVSLISFFFSGAESFDTSLENGFFYDGIKSIKLRERVIRPIKGSFSLAFERSSVYLLYRRIAARLLYTPTSTFGAYLVTFGVYVGLVYYVKLYALGEDASVYSLVNGCFIIVMAFPLLFSGKPLIRFLGDSAFVSRALYGCIELDAYKGEKKSAAVGSAIIFGSVCGVASYFCGEGRILLLLALAVFAMLIGHSPEMGMVFTAFSFSFVPRGFLMFTVSLTLVSYLFKVIRGKRNLRFGTAGVFAVMLLLNFLFVLMRGGGNNAWYAFCVVAVCLLASNLLVTYKLIKKVIQALVFGMGFVFIDFAYGLLTDALAGGDIASALKVQSAFFDNSYSFARFCLVMLPFLFCKAEGSVLFGRPLCFFVGTGCLAYCVHTGNTLLAIIIAAVLTLYLAVARRRFFRPLLMCFGLPIGVLYFARVPISFEAMGFADTINGWAQAIGAMQGNFFTGVGMTDGSLALGGVTDSHSMYLQTMAECGVVGFVLLVLCLASCCMRLFAGLSPVGNDSRRIAAAAGASVVAGLTLGCYNNLWAEGSLGFVFWLALGIAVAAYEVRKEEKRGVGDEYR